MRDKNGKMLLAVWEGYAHGGWRYLAAARTRKEVCEILDCKPEKVARIKGVYATGKLREL